ncbi:MAG: PKD domain-containing protein [Crocinitomicaceae bacterium]|nr:PKD domain-containing protein [Crocinitomicaceae bacterium]
MSYARFISVFSIFFFVTFSTLAQYCDSLVPSFTVDLTAAPNMGWTSLPIVRDGNCCGSTAPDNCLEFIITLHPSTIAVNFNIASGAVPPGALFYQIDCGPITAVGSPICLNGPGPHHLTFCKPGHNNNTFSITSFSSPIIGPDLTLNAACQGFIYAQYYDESTISWTSIAPGIQGAYDNLLSCTAGCDTTYITAPLSAPTYVDYLVCGMDVAGCDPNPICDTIRVTFIPPVSVSISASVTTMCTGVQSNLTANTIDGSGTYSYLWNTGQTSNSILVGGGTYFVEVVDTSGCHVATDTISIIEYPLPVVNAGPDQIVCEGTAITLSGSGATSYVWDNSVLDGMPFGQSVGTTIYTVTGTDANGCVNTDQVDVTVNPLPLVNAGADQTVCAGTAVILNGYGAVAYAWDNGVTDGAPFVPAVGTITYTATGTDANGCVNTDQVDVTVNPLPNVNAGADQTVCEGTVVTLNGAGAIAYVWNNGVTDGVPFVPAVGTMTYLVTGTDANGCVNTDQVDVTVNALPNVNAGSDQTACEGTAVTLNGAGAIVYAWDNGVTDGVPFAQAVGTLTYLVTGTDANGCVNTDQVDITINALPNVNAGPDQTVCEGTALTLNGAGASLYVWDNGVTDGTPFVPALGTITYTVIGTDANGCVNTDQVDVTVNPLPNVNAGTNQVVCEGTSVTLNGLGAISYSWDNGITNGVPYAQAVGTMTYLVTGTDANGCVNTDQVDVTVNPLPNVNAGPDQTVCEGATVTLNGAGAVAYVWDNGVTDGVPFIQVVGTMTYSVIGTDANGCENIDQVDVVVNPNPIVNAGPDQTVCEGLPITLTAVGSANLYWNTGVINGIPFTQNVGVVNYTVFDTLVTGCTSSDIVQVEVLPNPVVTAEDVVICLGESAILNGEGANNYAWSGGVIDGVEFYPTVSAEYSVVGTSLNGCFDEARANVTVNYPPVVDFRILDMSLTTSNPITAFDNLTTGAVSYNWDFGDGSPNTNEFEPTHTFPTEYSGEYQITLTAISIDGCPAERIKFVHVFQDYTIYVPNAFTPDFNGVNEVFNPVMTGFDKNSYTMYIFNRWGELVFETHDMEVGWDGQFAGQNFRTQDGVYTWKIIADIQDTPDTKIFVGHVNLMK